MCRLNIFFTPNHQTDQEIYWLITSWSWDFPFLRNTMYARKPFKMILLTLPQKNGFGESIPLFNCINLADAARLKANSASTHIILSLFKTYWHIDSGTFITGKLLIVKALLGKVGQIRGAPSSKAEASKSDFPGFASAFKLYSDDGKQKEWFFFDNSLLLPEYVIEFEYANETVCCKWLFTLVLTTI